MKKTIEGIINLPKIELHLHLDCSLSFEVVSKINPEVTKEVYNMEFIGPEKCNSLSGATGLKSQTAQKKESIRLFWILL